MDANLARSLRKNLRNNEGGGRDDLSFRKNFKGKNNDFGEEKLKEENIQKQVDYFGYVIEPFNMKNEREVGEITEDGYFAVNLKRERETRDPWLDSLEQDPYKGGIQKIGVSDAKSEDEDEEEKDEDGFKKPKKKPVKQTTTNKKNDIEDDPKLVPQKIICLKMELVEYLQKGETPSAAMIRLKEQLPKKVIPKKKNVRKKVKCENEALPTEKEEQKIVDEIPGEIENKLNRLIEISASLFELGVESVYILKQEDFVSELLALQKALESLDNPQADIDSLYDDEEKTPGGLKSSQDIHSPKKAQKEHDGQCPKD